VILSDCQACTNARKHPKSGIFQMGCESCAARSIASMPSFFNAAKQGVFTPEYRGVLHQLLPKLTQADAHTLVKGWVLPVRSADVRP
jgi:hypothetical protein